MSIGALSVERAVRPLSWNERGEGSGRWWETCPADAQERRAVVKWVRDLGKVAWEIREDGRTLALGFVDSLHEPSEAEIEKAKRCAAQRWWEIYP